MADLACSKCKIVYWGLPDTLKEGEFTCSNCLVTIPIPDTSYYKVKQELLTRKQLAVLVKGVRLLLLKEMGFKLSKEEIQEIVTEMSANEITKT